MARGSGGPRGKVKLEQIADPCNRKTSFKKRKKNLFKKVQELGSLCGVSACAIIYGPYDTKPDVWPSPQDACQVLSRFHTMPDMEKRRRMMNQEEFLRQSIHRLKRMLERKKKKNRVNEMTLLMNQSLAGKDLQSMSVEDLNDMARLVDEKMKLIDERIQQLRKTASQHIGVDERSVWRPEAKEKRGSEVSMVIEALQRKNWFMEDMKPSGQDHRGGDDQTVVPHVGTGSQFPVRELKFI
ncbi:PREDICTED: agamous-like MADS-box protein AGL80 [Nelumbo nucifera]|uniref:Agamous-like MADS-box protein AGL80 n=2 Tax=Nelumbo nucifera TaxID=4432 RepID=A0A1U8A441_NELNU|nr:PREDICTED: agamous-like MADS-box protein AGL80 [Nelumbo nucifera]DAD39268.1 TPA_asm: hypothetical protein HUJ06_013591 [Nelumbo nucifera]